MDKFVLKKLICVNHGSNSDLIASSLALNPLKTFSPNIWIRTWTLQIATFFFPLGTSWIRVSEKTLPAGLNIRCECFGSNLNVKGQCSFLKCFSPLPLSMASCGRTACMRAGGSKQFSRTVTRAACVYCNFFYTTECEVLNMEMEAVPGMVLIDRILCSKKRGKTQGFLKLKICSVRFLFPICNTFSVSHIEIWNSNSCKFESLE